MLSERIVPGVGPENAKIMLVGEAPGAIEDQEGIPFSGLSGKLLDTMLREAGTDRSQCYITNVVNQRPQDNNFEVMYVEGKPTDELIAHIQRLKSEIETVKPNIVVCLGNEAFRAVAGRSGITKWRGSVISSSLVPGTKCIGTYHPAAVSRFYEWRPIAVMDLARGVKESAYPELRIKQRHLLVGTNFAEVRAELAKLLDVHESTRIAFDIETSERQVTAISFSANADRSLCVPFFWKGESIFSQEEELELWRIVKQILEGPTKKIAQNAEFDCLFLWEIYGIQVANLWMDTMLAHHVVYPELPKGLDFLCSMYTDHPYYKDDISSEDRETFLKYNALDSCITRECADAIEQELKEFKVDGFYFNFLHKLIVPLTEIGHRGIKIDMAYRAEQQKAYKIKIIELQNRLNEIVGHPLNVNSPKQMQKYLYEELGNEKQTKVRKKKGADEKTTSVSTDAATLEKLNAKRPNEAIPIVLEIRERQKLLSTYLEAAPDSDGRMRTNYKIAGTKSGRLSSSETIFGTGLNIQNVPAGIARRLFIADEGCSFIQGDLSQAEARVVAYVANDERLIRVFEEGGDIHRKNAAIIFQKSAEEVTNEERQLAKKIVHASNYGMGPRTFKDTCWQELGLEISQTKAQEYLNMYFAQFIGVQRWHIEIQSQIKKNRTLTTPYGRKRMFFGYLGDDLFREAYSYIPQATVSDHLNKSLIELHQLFGRSTSLGATIATQVHDSLMVQCPDSKIETILDLMKQYMDTPVPATRNSASFRIPVDFKIGKNWNDLKERKVQVETVSGLSPAFTG